MPRWSLQDKTPIPKNESFEGPSRGFTNGNDLRGGVRIETFWNCSEPPYTLWLHLRPWRVPQKISGLCHYFQSPPRADPVLSSWATRLATGTGIKGLCCFLCRPCHLVSYHGLAHYLRHPSSEPFSHLPRVTQPFHLFHVTGFPATCDKRDLR